MALRAGVLIIGSLLWDEANARPQWRAQRLDEKNAKPALAPIRYGRFSTKRGAYAMVFSKLCYRHRELGRGIIVPFVKPIATFDDLQQEAEFLATAEGLGRNWEWGAVGLLKNTSSMFPVDFVEQWRRFFKGKTPHYQAFAGHTPSETPAINGDGLLSLKWPISGKDSPTYDLLLATPTKARIQDHPYLKRYPRPAEIGTLIPSDATNYFIRNVLHGIRTPEDASIWRTVTRRCPQFAAEWPQIGSRVSPRI